MADNPPISTEVPETVTVDTGADKAQLGDLNAEFADFWKEKDSETTTAPEAPGGERTGAAQETKETKPEPKPAAQETKPSSTETKPTPVETKPPEVKPKELTDDEVQRMELPPNAHPKLIENFKVIKEQWVNDRARFKAESDRAAKLESDLAEARKNSWTPEARADYEHASQIRRRFDFVSDPEFIQKFHAPVRTRFETIMDEAVQALPDKQAAAAWADHIKQNYQPDQLPREWWLNSVIAKVPNELDRQSLLTSVSDLIKMQKERDTEITRRTGDKAAFDNWITEKTNFTAQRVQEEIMNEIGEQEKRIQEVLPLDVEKAKTAEERTAIEAHNERFQKLNSFFVNTMQDLSKHGPRAWVRASVEATRAMLLDGEYKKLEEELKSTKAERDQYKTELDKIAGARRKISHTTGTPPAPSDKSKRSDNGGLSIKDLDVRKSFDNYDWGDR
jgi:hypothetical protein